MEHDLHANLFSSDRSHSVLLYVAMGEPSLAGLFMGANALLCKLSDSLMPIIAATALDKGEIGSVAVCPAGVATCGLLSVVVGVVVDALQFATETDHSRG